MTPVNRVATRPLRLISGDNDSERSRIAEMQAAARAAGMSHVSEVVAVELDRLQAECEPDELPRAA